jgi:hypothetical protein
MSIQSMFAPRAPYISNGQYTQAPDATAVAAAFGSAAAAPAPFATALGGLGNNLADAYKSYTQGMGGAGNQRVGAYDAYAGGLGQVANAAGQERQGFYQGNAIAEAARQAALGNVGTASLGSYGQAANAAMGAWAQNQMGYNQAMTGLGQANQTALAGLGSSRNSALGGLGQSYADLGGRLGAASAIGGLAPMLSGGGGFSATGPGGQIASGSYGGMGGGGMGGGGGGFSASAPEAYAGLAGLQQNLMANDISGSLNNNYAQAMQQLEDQHSSSRLMPSRMLGQTLSGLLTMGRDAYGQIAGGMNQFYDTQTDPANRAQFGDTLRGLNEGYDSTARDLNAYAGNLGAGYQTANANIGSVAPALQNLWDRSTGNMDVFQTPLQLAQRQRALDEYNSTNSIQDDLRNNEVLLRDVQLLFARNPQYAQEWSNSPYIKKPQDYQDAIDRAKFQMQQRRT